MITMQGNNGIYEGLSDEKPADVPVNTLYHALDSDKWYFWDGENWSESPQGSGSSFEPTEAQLTAMNSGITATDVEQINTNKTNISSIHKAADLYFSETEPTQGDITTGSYWISTTGVQIASRTIQLYDKYDTNITDNKYIEQTGAEKGNSAYEITDYIPISPSTDYIWQFSAGETNTYNAPSIAFYDSTKTLISGVVHESGVRYVTATSPANAAYIRCSVYKVMKDKAMLSQGTTEQTYKSYIEWT